MGDPAPGSDPDRWLHQAFPWGAVVERPGDPGVLAMRLDAVSDPVHPGTVEVRLVDVPGDTVGRCALEDLRAAAGSGRLVLADRVVRRPEAADAALLAEPFETLIGWQSKSDASWVARMRLHQAWYRTFRLRVPFGEGPWPSSTTRYGNMLTPAAAEQGNNFISEVAHREYAKRVDDGRPGVDPWRTTRNLLASQTMAFNLFAPMVHDPDFATEVFRQFVPDLERVVAGEFERPSDALGDHTAFDVYFEYEKTDGTTCCLAIETKLTEPFSQADYDWNRYLRHPAFDRQVWNTADPGVLGDRRWSQLWRNHLLARAESAALRLGEPSVLVVHHPDDSSCATNVTAYQALLQDSRACRSVDVATVLGAVRTAHGSSAAPQWLDEFADRYLRLELSAALTELHGTRYRADAPDSDHD